MTTPYELHHGDMPEVMPATYFAAAKARIEKAYADAAAEPQHRSIAV